MAVADEHERRVGEVEGGMRGFLREHVLPDGVARAGMEELDAVVRGVGLEAGEELPRRLRQHARGPGRGGGRLVVEVADGELAENDQVMVPDEATVGPGPHGVAALVRQRPVANGVA